MANFRTFIGSELLGIKQHISAVKSIIPEKTSLAPAERRSMFKLHIKRKDFVKNALNFMRRNPSTVPNYVDVSACNNHMHLFDQYSELLMEVDTLKKQIEDARLLVGHEILMQTRLYFQNAKNGSDSGVAQFETIYKALKPFYAVGRNSKKLQSKGNAD